MQITNKTVQSMPVGWKTQPKGQVYFSLILKDQIYEMCLMDTFSTLQYLVEIHL